MPIVVPAIALHRVDRDVSVSAVDFTALVREELATTTDPRRQAFLLSLGQHLLRSRQLDQAKGAKR